MKQIYLTGVKYVVLDKMEITKITGQKQLNIQSTAGAWRLTSITTLHKEEIRTDHVNDGSKAGADQNTYALPGGGREELRVGRRRKRRRTSTHHEQL